MKRTEQGRNLEMYRLLAQWDKSELSQKAFSQAHGINYSVFKYWKKKRADKRLNKSATSIPQQELQSKMSTGNFIPIELEQNIKIKGLRISYPNGVQVICPTDLEFGQLKLLIKIY